MPRPEDVSRQHIEATVIGFLKGERDADWTEVALVTLHPREEIKIVFGENADRTMTPHGCPPDRPHPRKWPVRPPLCAGLESMERPAPIHNLVA